MSNETSTESTQSKASARRRVTLHSVVKFTVLRSAPRCPVFHPGDVFYVRQHVLESVTSTMKNFCYHTIFDLYEVYTRVRQGPVGGKEVFNCRDKGMVQMEVERLADEEAMIGRAEEPACKDLGHTPIHHGGTEYTETCTSMGIHKP